LCRNNSLTNSSFIDRADEARADWGILAADEGLSLFADGTRAEAGLEGVLV